MKPHVKTPLPSPLAQRCYELLCSVPAGKVTTYKELAHALGTKGYRAVGQILNKNPNAPTVPCHRVVGSSGALGGYAYGVSKKISLLKAEGISISNDTVDNLSQVLHRW
jgi:methylated-DNA-[protein]-cysteine S-methyltransferase